MKILFGLTFLLELQFSPLKLEQIDLSFLSIYAASGLLASLFVCPLLEEQLVEYVSAAAKIMSSILSGQS